MKKYILIFSLITQIFYAQKGTTPVVEDTNITPNGVLDNIFDQYGNKYKLSDIKIEATKVLKDGKTSTTTLATCGDGGYFDLFFEIGSGMETVGNASHDARRAVVCQVFKDISNFINSPLTSSGKKVSIWVRNPTSMGLPSSALGGATSFYSIPNYVNGGIIDGEIWKTIHTGTDSYNYVFPLTSTNYAYGSPFYHGAMAFNFTSFSWNTNLSIPTPSTQYDLYSVVLHEVIHSLGFVSLIDPNGLSTFGSSFKYYSRYDRFLKSSSNNFIITNNSSTCSMYGYNFNPALNTSILHPNPTSAACLSDNTVCSTAVKYVGSINVPTFTPNCFVNGSSLSHFEDQCVSPFVNNAYFAMSNANGLGSTKRFLKPEERQVLCDIGYNVNLSFGDSNTFQGQTPANYYGNTVCEGIAVAGINDGINYNAAGVGTYSFVVIQGNSILINNILNNDINANSFECLEDLSSSALFPTTLSLSGSSINFSSNLVGIHLLRYVPVHTNGQRGNITYIYVNVISNCTASPCELVKNGGFENSISCGQFNAGLTPAVDCWYPLSLTPDLYKRNCTANVGGLIGQIPSNYSTPPTDTWNNGLNNNNTMLGLAGLAGSGHEAMQTSLVTSILPNKEYLLSFKAKVLNNFSYSTGSTLQNLPTQIFFAGSQNMLLPSIIYTVIPSQLTILATATVPNNNQWNDFSIILNNTTEVVNFLSVINAYKIYSANDGTRVYVVIDDISIKPYINPTFNSVLPICYGATISPLPTTSTNGISGVWSPSINNLSTTTYTFTPLASTCANPTTLTITVLPANDPLCSTENCPNNLTFSTPELATLETYQAANTIITSTNYIVNAGSTITLTAGNSITFTPLSEIKANSTSNFTAKIEACSPSSRKTNEKEKQLIEEEKLTLYPNPTNEIITISTNNSNLKKITIYSIEGKMVYDKEIEKTNSHQLNVSSFQNGIYLALIETVEGKVYKEKIIKN